MTSKTCTKCGINKTVDEFGAAKHQPDGKNKTCKQCCRRVTERRRRQLDWMIKGCPLHLREQFISKHHQWRLSGYAEHKRPVVVGNAVKTSFDRKNDGFFKKGIVVKKMKKGIVVQTFGSISHAMRQLRCGYYELKWLSDTGVEKNGFTFKIEKE